MTNEQRKMLEKELEEKRQMYDKTKKDLKVYVITMGILAFACVFFVMI